MDLTSSETVVALCRQYGITPRRERGQNFLIDSEVLEIMAAAADLKEDDTVLEIGPGFGVLTSELTKRAGRVVAVEADRRLVTALHEVLSDYKNVTIVPEDILKFPISELRFPKYEYKIVANLPYQITSAVLKKFLSEEPRPSEMTVMVQKEVAERICAEPGEMSLLAVSVQFFGRPEIIEVVPRTAFWPVPEVDSAILRITRIKNESEANLKRIDPENFFKVVKIGFSARRKQLHNNLSGGLGMSGEKVKEILVKLGFDPRARAQDLDVGDWIRLAKKFF